MSVKISAGYFLEIFLPGPVADEKGVVNQYHLKILKKLRKLKNSNSGLEIWPKRGVSNIIKITCPNTFSGSFWEEIKTRVKEIIKNEELEGGEK